MYKANTMKGESFRKYPLLGVYLFKFISPNTHTHFFLSPKQVTVYFSPGKNPPPPLYSAAIVFCIISIFFMNVYMFVHAKGPQFYVLNKNNLVTWVKDLQRLQRLSLAGLWPRATLLMTS